MKASHNAFHADGDKEIGLKLDVLISMMDKVRLKKENYIEVMRSVKLFIDNKHTQKKGYKILTKIVANFDSTSLEELVQIKHEITPMMRG